MAAERVAVGSGVEAAEEVGREAVVARLGQRLRSVEAFTCRQVAYGQFADLLGQART